MIKRFLLSAVLFVLPLWAHADWAADRDASAGYVTVTTLATAVDEAVPFCVVYLSDLPADFHTAMTTASDTDGKTIRVSTSDGVTELACVPIGVNTGTDTGCLIFLGTGMSASVDVDYRIYVGNASLTMPAASAGEQLVFAAYAGVYFPGVSTRDWTSGGRSLTAVNSPGTAASGYEGITAASYTSASSQYHKYEGTPAVTSWPMTWEVLAYANNVTDTMRVVSLGSSTTDNPIAILQFSQTNDRPQALFRGNSTTLSPTLETSGTQYVSNTWYRLTATRSGTGSGTSTVYMNGVSQNSDSTTIAALASLDRTSIGAALRAAVTNYMTGRVAVALLSDSARSADYVSTMQDNWAGALYSAGAWTPASSTCNSGSTGWVLLTANSQTTTANADWANLADSLVDDMNTTDVSLDDGGVFLSETLRFYDMDFDTTTIPTGADSYTVTILVKKDFQSGSGRDITDEVVKYVDETGTQIGDNLAITASSWPSSPASIEYPVTGHTFDGTEFDVDSGFVIQADGANTNGATLTEVYVAWIKVDWTCPSTIETASGFFALED